MTLRQDVEVYQGEWIQMPLTVWADAAKTQVKQLGSATIDYRIGLTNTDRLILRLTGTPNANGSSAVVSDGSMGQAVISIRAADTQALRARRYAHQIIVTDAAGKPNVVTDGSFTVKETLPDV